MRSEQLVRRKVEAVNAIRHCANLIAPPLIALFTEGVKINADGSIAKKDKPRIEAILAPYKDTLRPYLAVGYNTVTIEVKTHYTVNETSCAYVSETVFIYDYRGKRPYDFDLLELMSLEEVIDSERLYFETELEAVKLQDKLNKLRRNALL